MIYLYKIKIFLIRNRLRGINRDDFDLFRISLCKLFIFFIVNIININSIKIRYELIASTNRIII